MKKKKIKKSIESLEKQKEEHIRKMKDYDGKNYALIDYWGKEIKRFEDKIKELKENMKEE